MEIPGMACTHAKSQVLRTFRSVPFVELKQFRPSQVAVISPFLDQLMRFIARFRSVDGSEFGIELALREALANAIVPGNQEDPHKRVYVVCRCTTDGEVSITIQDEGKGLTAARYQIRRPRESPLDAWAWDLRYENLDGRG
jgi:anti-sigma regulatory factor (Ser/Thr protein kinase)